MKQLVMTCWMCVSFFSMHAQGPLQLSTTKTTSLIFPFPIRHVDRGTNDVLVQQIKEAGNILLVKAAVQQFAETNLSVVTADGSVYSFKVLYNEHPESWLFHFPALQKPTIAGYANAILDNHREVHGIKDDEWNMHARVNGFYIKDDVLYCQLVLYNRGTIDYDIELMRFFIKDKKKIKRTAIQETELRPLFIAGNIQKVKARDRSVVVVALDKFTIPDAKFFSIQIMEKNGGRHLQLRVSNDKLVKAIPLPDMK